MLKDTQTLRIYRDEMVKLATLGFIDEVHPNSVTGNPSDMPHHPVIRSDKVTINVGQVFGGSAKTRWSANVNDCLENGPNLNPDLLGVFLRFRVFRVAWVADVEQALLNFQLTEQDSNMLRFLWIPSPANEEIVNYKWKRLLFGLNTSQSGYEDYNIRKCRHLFTLDSLILCYWYNRNGDRFDVQLFSK